MALPDIPTDEWASYQADTFSAQANQRIDALSFSTAADSRIAQLDQMYAPPPEAPPSSDSLTNPLDMQGSPGAGSETGSLTPVSAPLVVDTAPSPATPDQPAPALPAPSAPAPTN